MANTTELKMNNMLNIIRVIQMADEITKPELSRRTGLTAATVHNFVNELVLAGIVMEEGNANSNGGRKALLYRLNADFHHIVGVSMLVNSVEVAIFDLQLRMKSRFFEKVRFDRISVEEGIQRIVALLKKAILETETEKIMGIGVSIPGSVDEKNGNVRNLPGLPVWKGVPLKGMLAKSFSAPIFIDKNTCGSALALKWNNVVSPKKTTVFISLLEGVAAGVLIDGQIYRGEKGAAGEIGHLTVNPDGPQCSCGGKGCLELYSSDISVVQSVRDRVSRGESALISELCQGDVESINIDMVLEAEEKGDAIAHEEMERAVKYIGVCLVNAVKIFDPYEIVIEHYWLKKHLMLWNRLLQSVYDDDSFVKRSSVQISLSALENLLVMGAATLVLDSQLTDCERSGFLSILKNKSKLAE